MGRSEEISSGYKNIFFHISQGSYPTVHSHNGYWEFMYIEHGEITHNYNGLSKKISANTLCFLRPTDKHSIIGNQDATRLVIGVRSEYLLKYLDVIEEGIYDTLLNQSHIPTVYLKEDKASEVKKIENSLLTMNDEDYYKALQCLFHVLIGEIVFSEVKNPKTIYRYSKPVNTLLQLISNPNNLALSMPELVKETSYSYSHTNRLFLNEVGVTLSDYLRGKKIDHAKNLLINTDKPLKEIAALVGYNNYSNFSLFFQSKVGVTPADYREGHNRSIHKMI